ncbi:MAG TPA: hypothetical protein VF189_05200 [Patescibacteria group bacterium]
MKRAILPILILILGLGFAIVMVFNKQIFQQNASVVTLKAFAVKGSVYLDSNVNGTKNTGEVNYTGTPKPLVRLALFTEVCRPSITPKLTGNPTPAPTITYSPTPTPSLAPNCHYLCPRVACITNGEGHITCPSCTPICNPTPTPHQSSPTPVPTTTNGKNVQAAEDSTVGKVVSSQVSNSDDIKQLDACQTRPLKVVDCSVNDDGTYSCVVNDITISRATLIINPPSGYIVTSKNNPFVMNAQNYANNPTATVDFGIAKESSITPPAGCYFRVCTIACPTTNPNCCSKILVCPSVTPKITEKVTPTPVVCIPQPDCLSTHKCSYPTPPGGWCPSTGKPLTNDETNRLLIYLNTLLRKGK